jgi:co-chaperonin GroES (HSP10)
MEYKDLSPSQLKIRDSLSKEDIEISENIKLFNRYVLIKQNEAESETKSGFLIIKENQVKKVSGIILAVGSLIEDETIKVYSEVVFNKWDATELRIKGRDYIIVNADSLIMEVSLINNVIM